MEIERKWLFTNEDYKAYLSHYEVVNKYTIIRAYLNIDYPEIRISEIRTPSGFRAAKNPNYRITIKSKGQGVREEINKNISEKFFKEIRETIPYHSIWKNKTVYKLPDSLFLEVSEIDKNLVHGFTMAEIEFPSEESMERYIRNHGNPIPGMKDVTDDLNYYLSNYWMHTRVLRDYEGIYPLAPRAINSVHKVKVKPVRITK